MSFKIKPQKPKSKPVHLCVGLPAYTGQVFASTMTALAGDLVQLAQRGAKVTLNLKTGMADIADCRALLVAEFLANPEFTHLIMIDSDVTWAGGAIPRLLSHDVDFVCGLYPKRSDPITFDFRSADDKGEDMTFTLEDGLLEVWGVSAGFILMSRSMLQKMADAYEHLAFNIDPKMSRVSKAWDLFETYRMPDGAKLGEDYAFCQRWRDIGGRVFIDPAINMGHIGYKMFAGQLGHFAEPATTQTGEAA